MLAFVVSALLAFASGPPPKHGVPRGEKPRDVSGSGSALPKPAPKPLPKFVWRKS